MGQSQSAELEKRIQSLTADLQVVNSDIESTRHKYHPDLPAHEIHILTSEMARLQDKKQICVNALKNLNDMVHARTLIVS